MNQKWIIWAVVLGLLGGALLYISKPKDILEGIDPKVPVLETEDSAGKNEGSRPDDSTGNGGSTGTKPAEKTPLEKIRSVELADMELGDVDYDVAGYVVYYKFMETENGQFSPEKMVTHGEAAEVFSVLMNRPISEPENPEAPLTRIQLASLLYETATRLNLPTRTSKKTVSYLDVEADQEEVIWAAEYGLFDSFVGNRLLPDTAVSRLQMAQAIVAMKAIDNGSVAYTIWENVPDRDKTSIALENHDEIQAAVDAAAERYGAKGLQVAVIENGVVTDTYVYGWATKNTDEMTADHKIRIASISKVGVGIAAQLLREEGVVDLDADISQYWGVTVQNPKYKDIPITISSMLSHTSSIVNAGDDASRAYNTVKQKLQGSGYSGGVPGDIGYWVYNNYAFSVLGMTLELAADRVLDDVLGQRLYVPMDIDAAFGSGDLKNTDLLATIYRANGEVGRSVASSKSMHSPEKPGEKGSFFAGGMTASAYDVAKLIALLAGDGVYEGVRLLEAESVAIMETYNETAVPGGSYQAYPMRRWPNLYGRENIYFHTGSAYGVFNCVTYDPATGDGVVVLSTGASGAKDDYGIYKVGAQINEYIYELLK